MKRVLWDVDTQQERVDAVTKVWRERGVEFARADYVAQTLD